MERKNGVSIFDTAKLKFCANTYIFFMLIVDDARMFLQETPNYFRCLVFGGIVENYYFRLV